MKTPVIFIGVPRTGTGSMSQLLQERGIVNSGDSRNTPASVVREGLTEEEWDNSFKVAFVRHPIDRAISAMATTIGDILTIEDGMGFNPLLFKPMVEFIDEHLDFIGRYERIDEDWERLRRMFPTLKPLIHVNKSPTGDPHPGKKDLTKHDEEFVREYYEEDFEQFGYE